MMLDSIFEEHYCWTAVVDMMFDSIFEEHYCWTAVVDMMFDSMFYLKNGVGVGAREL